MMISGTEKKNRKRSEIFRAQRKARQITKTRKPLLSYRKRKPWPNPFNPSTKVQFTVPENGNVRLLVYNVIGQEVATLFNGAVEAGNLYTVNFDGARKANK